MTEKLKEHKLTIWSYHGTKIVITSLFLTAIFFFLTAVFSLEGPHNFFIGSLVMTILLGTLFIVSTVFTIRDGASGRSAYNSSLNSGDTGASLMLFPLYGGIGSDGDSGGGSSYGGIDSGGGGGGDGGGGGGE